LQFSSSPDSFDDVQGPTTGANCDDYIAARCQASDLTRKCVIDAMVIPDRRDGGCIRRKCDRRRGQSVGSKPIHQFSCEALRICGAVLVPEGKDPMSMSKTFRQEGRGALKVSCGLSGELASQVRTSIHVVNDEPSHCLTLHRHVRLFDWN
jgi:hypothetical protein